MASYKNFSKKVKEKSLGGTNNFDLTCSHDPKKQKSIDYEEWTKFMSYYRHYIDKFAVDILGMDNLFPFQKLLLRAMGRYPNIMILACRGLTKSYICAIFMICIAILYPGIKIGIVSGNGNQARMVIKQKIQGELIEYDSIKREILGNIRTATDDCVVEFKNGSSIRAISLGINGQGDGVRGYRFQVLLHDEARLIKEDIIKTVLEPMTITPRPNNIRACKMLKEDGNMNFKGATIEDGKMIFISSAYLKICDMYQKFLNFYNKMRTGDKKFFVASLDYKVGVDAGLFTEEKILEKKDDPQMTLDKWTYEYCGQFVGSSNESYYPYEITTKCRNLYKCELQQPENCKYDYIITHDVAVSSKNGSDNACTHVIKLVPNGKGTFNKEVILSQTMNGASLREQKDFLRELIHIKFPNTIKLVIDQQSAGEGLLSLFAEPWNYRDKKGNVIEFEPLILDDDYDTKKMMPDARMIIRGIKAYADFNNTFFPYMKTCFENGNLKLLIDSVEVDDDYKEKLYSPEEYYNHVEHDILIGELSNIKQMFSQNGVLTYGRIVSKNKRDRVTSLMYGLSVVFEYEKEGKANLYKNDTSLFDYLMKFLN